MSLLDYFRSLQSPRVRLAWAVALAADAVQIAALPLFGEGALSPADTVLDLAVGAVLVRLLGWHWAFLPTLVAELVPGLDLFPTWTAAVWYVTRNSAALADQEREPSIQPQVEILPPDPAPTRRR
ncbi:MAG: hypothetical protein WB952_03560 [Terriglobales bacterium]